MPVSGKMKSYNIKRRRGTYLKEKAENKDNALVEGRALGWGSHRGWLLHEAVSYCV